MKNQLLILFVRKPQLGKVKTRLAKDTSDEIALNIYNDLLQHTHKITKSLDVDKWVFYTDEIVSDDIWDDGDFYKLVQEQGD